MIFKRVAYLAGLKNTEQESEFEGNSESVVVVHISPRRHSTLTVDDLLECADGSVKLELPLADVISLEIHQDLTREEDT